MVQLFKNINILIGLLGVLAISHVIAQDKPGGNSNIVQQGTISLGLNSYWSSLDPPADTISTMRTRSAPDFVSTLTGNYSLFLKKQDLKLPISFVFSNQYPSFQPFSQYRFSPVYKKWFKGYLGYNNISYSPFTLGGASFLGAGVDLNPGWFRIGAVYGIFNKRKSYEDFKDSSNHFVPSYKRKGFGLKLGIGKANNHVDFSAFYAYDDRNSLNITTADSTVKPQANLCTGISSRLTLLKEVTWDLHLGLSSFNHDTRSSSDIALIELIPDYAFQMAFNINKKYYSLKLGYRYVTQDYASLGTYFIPSDLQKISLVFNSNPLKKKTRFSTNWFYQHNNLKENKVSTVHNVSVANSITINLINKPFQSFTLDILNTNFYTLEHQLIKVASFHVVKIDSVLGDSLISYPDTIGAINILNVNVGITPRLTFKKENSMHSIFIFTNYTRIKDYNKTTSDFDDGHSFSINAGYSISYINASHLTLNTSVNSYSSYIGAGESSTNGFTLGISRVFFKSLLLLNTTASVNRQNYSQTKSWTTNISGGGSIRPNKHHELSLNLYFTNNNSQSVVIEPFNEFKINLLYVYKI